MSLLIVFLTLHDFSSNVITLDQRTTVVFVICFALFKIDTLILEINSHV